MIRQEEVYKIGRLGKPHGIKGEISLMFQDDIFDRVDAEYLVLSINGILVPFFMEEYRFRSDNLALVKFEDIDSQKRAAELTGCDVFFPRCLTESADGDSLSYARITGFSIIEASSNSCVGRIAAIDDSTENVLFEMEDGSLIPVTEEWITAIDEEHSTITMTLPEGLLDL